MSTAQNNANTAFRAALTRFEAALSPSDLADLKIGSLADVHRAIGDIQRRQGSEKKLRNLNRIKLFLEGMKQYEQLVKVFLNVSMVPYIWGPIKFLLLITSTWVDAFDGLLDAYQRLGEQLPQIVAYGNVENGGDPRMQELLEWVFTDILEFHRRALIFFKKQTWRQLFWATWKVFDTRIGRIVESLQRHKELVESHASLLDIQAAQKMRAATETQFEEMARLEEKRQRITVTEWLECAKSQLDQVDAKAVRGAYPQSGRWLLERTQMEAWLDFQSDEKPLLWIRAIPGAGKTILASVVIERAEQQNLPAAVIYFYCKYQDSRKNRMTAILRELLLQCSLRDTSIVPFLYEKCAAAGETKLESPAALKDVLATVLKSLDKVAIVIDGLDECEEPERKQTLAYLLPVIEEANRDRARSVRALFTSQDVAEMRRLLRKAEVIALRPQDNAVDIRSYTEYWAAQIKVRFDLQDDEVRRIIEHVTHTAKGMFLYAKLVMQNLYNSISRDDLHAEIDPDTLPKGIEQAYHRIARRILENPDVPPSRRKTVEKLLGWIVCAKRPLKWHEIQGAVALRLEDRTFAYEDRRLRDDAKELCGSLVDVHACGSVELVHSTARKYLIKEYIKSDEEETQMAGLCLDYLTLACFDAEVTDEEIRRYITEAYYAFQDYAAAHWLDHLKASIQRADQPHVDDDLVETVDDFFTKHWCESYKRNPRIPKQMKSAFRALEDHDFHDQLLQVYYHLQADVPSSESTTDPLVLYATVRRIRRVFEEIVTPLARRGGADAERFRAHYGINWFKCPRPSCGRFADGFASARERDEHDKRHTRPYRCDVKGCFAAEIGLASEQSLRKHKADYHSDGGFLFPTRRTRKVSAEKVDLLFRLARDGDIAALERHLDHDCVSVTNAQGNTLLHIAARLRNVYLARTILSHAAWGCQFGVPSVALKDFVNTKNKRNVSPFRRAALAVVPNPEMAILLLAHGAYPSSDEVRHMTRNRSHEEKIDITRMLLQACSNTPPDFSAHE